MFLPQRLQDVGIHTNIQQLYGYYNGEKAGNMVTNPAQIATEVTAKEQIPFLWRD